MEPRTPIPGARIAVIKPLTEQDIPCRVMVAPIIPMVNDMELEKTLKAASEAGAKQAGYVLIRLPYEVKTLFKEWLQEHYPQRAEHIMSLIRQMRGEGEFAQLIQTRFRLACKRFNLNRAPSVELNVCDFTKLNNTKSHPQQLKLWDEDF